MTRFIASPNVLMTARKYYNCPDLIGMPTENQEENVIFMINF